MQVDEQNRMRQYRCTRDPSWPRQWSQRKVMPVRRMNVSVGESIILVTRSQEDPPCEQTRHYKRDIVAHVPALQK